jgi:tripartite-type tricarboxylate transporter receptor subunit TctC
MAFSAAGGLLPGLQPQAEAQTFERAVRLIVPFAPGGTSDILARLIGPKLSEAIGQPVVIENKPGAGGNLGADLVAKAPKDGHTLLLVDVGNLATSPSLFSSLTYDVQKDLAPVSMVMFAPYVVAVHPSVPAKTFQELASYGKANPGKLAVANSGVGAVNHITGILVGKGAGIQWKAVPYKGGSAATRAVVAGESNVIINGATATQSFITSGQLQGVAVTGEKRMASLPDLPTFKELGLPAENAGTWQGVLTTAGTPQPMIDRLNAELHKILATPEMQQKIREQGGEVRVDTPAEFASWLGENIAFWGGAIREAGIKVE